MTRILQIIAAASLFFLSASLFGLTHKVQKGETLSLIAAKYKVTVWSIKTANKISNTNNIRIGQVLEIPDKSKPSPVREYKVKSGDSLSTIARSHGVTLDALKKANSISNANKIVIGQILKIPGEAKPYTSYKVRNGDSLSTIASRHGVSSNELSKINGLRNANRIRIGQILKIPGDHAIDNSSHPLLSSSLKSSLDRISVRSGAWKNIVVHHSATKKDTAKGMDRYHREERRMENGLAYHFVIGNGRGMKDGEIYIGDRWKKQIHGGHLKSSLLNKISIGICLVGNFETSRPTRKQMEQLEALVAYLLDKGSISDSGLTSHKLIHPNHTVCPGKYFPIKTLQSKF